MPENPTYDERVLDHRDLGHLGAAAQTEEWVNFPEAFDQFPQHRGSHMTQRGRYG